jgi:acrylyl-CoA reductase (NADPH)
MAFTALVLDEAGGKVSQHFKQLEDKDLPQGEVLVRVQYSDLNYKDGLILNGLARLVRSYPHIPGIDLAGTVEHSSAAEFKPGDAVVLTGWGTGERHWGGYSQKQRAKAGHLLKLPQGMSPKRAMAIGTAGLTAMLSVLALERHGLEPGAGEVLVTGATGGLGSVAVAILAKLGYKVAGSTGKADRSDYLKSLGAATIIDRKELSEAGDRPLESARWAGAIDTVGGTTLARVFAQMNTHGSVAVCGNAGGNDLKTTVLPLILRGVNLLGIDSNYCPQALRREAWQRLTTDLPTDKLDAMTEIVPLKALPDLANKILKGQIGGRVVVDVNA